MTSFLCAGGKSNTAQSSELQLKCSHWADRQSCEISHSVRSDTSLLGLLKCFPVYFSPLAYCVFYWSNPLLQSLLILIPFVSAPQKDLGWISLLLLPLDTPFLCTENFPACLIHYGYKHMPLPPLQPQPECDTNWPQVNKTTIHFWLSSAAPDAFWGQSVLHRSSRLLSLSAHKNNMTKTDHVIFF